ncbi:hypothetical protein GCM10027414_00800 [Humibacter ginsengiterrae]
MPRLGTVPIDSAHVLIVDPMHLDYDVLAYPLEERDNLDPAWCSKTLGIVLAVPAGDCPLHIDTDAQASAVRLTDGWETDKLVMLGGYPETGFVNVTEQYRAQNLEDWAGYDAEEATDAEQ